jgi:hypothetical protein
LEWVPLSDAVVHNFVSFHFFGGVYFSICLLTAIGKRLCSCFHIRAYCRWRAKILQ